MEPWLGKKNCKDIAIINKCSTHGRSTHRKLLPARGTFRRFRLPCFGSDETSARAVDNCPKFAHWKMINPSNKLIFHSKFLSLFLKIPRASLTLVWWRRLLRCGLFPASRNNRLPLCSVHASLSASRRLGQQVSDADEHTFLVGKKSEFWDWRNVIPLPTQRKFQTTSKLKEKQTTDQPSTSTFRDNLRPHDASIARWFFILEWQHQCIGEQWSQFVELRTFCAHR